jgi:endonuclease YncB( thermonuclease family)
MTIRRIVKKVIDGDTVIVNRKIGSTNRVRLAGVRAPENYQKGGRAATNKLRRMVEGKMITIVPVGRNYGRVVANIRHKRKSVNKRLK